jgi:hypothetical protein
MGTTVNKALFKGEIQQIYHCVCRNRTEVESYRSRNQITVRGNEMPNPIQFFEESNFPDYLTKEIR